jgi:hypothetical protein
MDRIVAPDRASLSTHTLPAVPRLGVLSMALRQRHRYSEATGQRQALAILGDGGMGKSVLLGQLLDYLENDLPDHPFEMLGRPSGAAVLVACAAIPPATNLLSLKSADEAFGLAVDPLSSSSSGLLGLLATLKSEYQCVTLLIDTLDLLINEDSLQAITNLIGEALNIGDVVITCRSYEFLSYLAEPRQSAPRLVHRLTEVNLPKLDPKEIVEWARLYLSSNAEQAGEETTGFILALEGGVEKNGSLRQLCAVPIRLAITCETFATSGHVPEDLTVTELYDAYWDRRVHREAGKSDTPASYAKEQAALSIASNVVTPTGSILVQVPKARVGINDLPGVRLLASEGVVRDLNVAWEFFHQTFAEYAYARWLLANGIDSGEIAELSRRLQSGQTSLWPIAASLLLQVADYGDYITLVGYLPALGPEGARVHTLAALRRSEDDALQRVLRDLEQDPGLMIAVLAALADAPTQHLETSVKATLKAIRLHPAELAGAATAALALLLPRGTPDSIGSFLTAGLDAVIDAHPHLSTEARDYLPGALLRPLIDLPIATSLLAIMLERYSKLGVPGRQATIRAHLNRPLSEDQIAELGRVVLVTDCPPLKSAELVRVIQLLWSCPKIRASRGWHSWRDVLADSLAHGWNEAQIQYAIHISDEDVITREEFLTDVLSGAVEAPGRYINAFKQLAKIQAQWVAMWILAHKPADNSLVMGAIAQGAEGLAMGTGSETRMQLIAWLTPGRVRVPRNIWPAQIILAGGSVPAHQQIFNELVAAGESKQVFDSALDAWLFQTPRHILNELTGQFRLLLQAGDAETRRTRARLEGRLADEDESARTWIENEVLNGQSPRIAGTAVKTLADAVRISLETISPEIVDWLGKLLPTEHADAARRIAEILANEQDVDDASLLPTASSLMTVTLDRMRVACRLGQDSQLSRALLELLVRLDIVAPMTSEMVREVYSVVRSRLVNVVDDSRLRASDAAAAVRDLGHLCGTLMSKRLSSEEVRDRIADALLTTDVDSLGKRVSKTVSSMLIGLGYRDPQTVAWMEDLFAKPNASVVKRAIAEAVLRLDGDHVGGRASALKDHPDCPQPVAAYILGRLRS